jgi:ATP-dependent helicase/nuclease subunit A
LTPRDAAAREGITTALLDRSLLVEAAAGSGKTTSLVARVVNLLAAGVSPDGMAVITFTRKAAAELRGRVQLLLERAVRNEVDATRRERLRRAVREYDLLFTGTVHSFCGRLLRERPVEAGVPPDFAELDEIAEEGIRREAWLDLVARLTLQGDPDWRILLEAGLGADALGEALKVMCTHEEVEFPADPVDLPPPAELWQRFLAAFEPLGELVPPVLASTVTCPLMATVAAIRRAIRLDRGRRIMTTLALAAGRATAAWGGGELPEVRFKDWTNARTRQERDAAVEKPRALASELGREAAEIGALWRGHLYFHAMRVLRPAVRAVRERRRAYRGLNFADLLVCTARLLRERADVRADLQARFHHLLVDEFQDTDPLQAEVMLLLTADDPAESDWRRVRPRPGALFVVGDPKQSIYRFTRADIGTYVEVRSRFAAGEVVSLTSNFRSAPALTEHVNGACAESFARHAEKGTGPPYVALDAERPALEGRVAGIRLLVDEGSGRKGEVTDRDATRVARFIRHAVGSRFPVDDPDTGQARPCRPDDFLVLTQVKRPLALYARALEEEGIAVEVSGGGALQGSDAVFALVQVLRAVADPHDQPAVVGALRGPFFGVSDRALYRHRRAGGSFDPFAGQPPGRVAEALAGLRRWTEAGRDRHPPALVHQVLEDSGYLALVAASPSASTEGGLLAWVIDRARVVVEQGGGLGALVMQLLADLDDPQIEGLPLEPGRPGSVQVMNLHKAKGLEAPVVILAAPRHELPEWVTWRVVRGAAGSPQGFLTISRPMYYGGAGPVLAAPLDWAAHERAELEFRAAERTRLMYVAATRARDLLVVSVDTDAKGEQRTGWGEVLGAEAWPQGLPEPDPAPRSPAPAADLSAEVVRGARESRAARVTRALVPSYLARRVTALGPPFEYADRERADGAPGGRAWGRLVHALIERALALGLVADETALERAAGFVVELEEGDDPGLASQAAGLVFRLMHSAVWAELAAAEERHVEVPVAGPLRPDEGPGRIHGVIDCVYLRGGEWTLLDWKTGSALTPAGELQPAYVDQVRRYAELWRAATGLAPDRVGLVALDDGAVHWVQTPP